MSNWKGYSANGETVWYVDSLEEILEFSCGDTTGGGTVSHSWQVNNSDSKEGTYSLYSPYNPPQSYADVEFAIQRFEVSDYSGPFEASCWIKTNELQGGVWIGALFWVDEPDGIRVIAHQYTDKITGTNDWTQVSVTIPDSSYDVSNFDGIFYIERMRDAGEVWVDEAVCMQIGDTLPVPAEYKITYEYDRRANRDYTSIKLPDGTKEEQIYKYDNINRLKRTVYQDSGGPPSLQYEYTYDAVGNRTYKKETNYDSPDTNEYTYNYNTNNNRLTGITETAETYTYNDRGDLLTATGGYTFTYDREGRLEEIIEASGEDTNKFEFSYTSEGRRFRKIFLKDSSGVVEADTTYYVYDGMFAVAELDGSLDLRSKYIYTNGMLVGRIDSSGEFYQYFHDGLGSITMICDSSGTYQNLYTYDDFGGFRKKDEEVSNSYCYTGQERDEEPSGLYNLRARYYAAGIGRFTQEDPMMEMVGSVNKQELNGYTYAINNPINLIDPFGLCGEKPEDKWGIFADHFKGNPCVEYIDANLNILMFTGGEITTRDGRTLHYFGFTYGVGIPPGCTGMMTDGYSDVSLGPNFTFQAGGILGTQVGWGGIFDDKAWWKGFFVETGIFLVGGLGGSAIWIWEDK